jgi:serine O-acetyltransferase
MSAAPAPVTREQVQARIQEHRRLQPPLGRALRMDAATFAINRGDRVPRGQWAEWRNVLRLLWRSGDYFGVALYRLRIALRNAHVPILPGVLNKICIWMFAIRIGDYVLMEPGVYINHGNVVIDGVTRIGTGSVITGWVTIGLKAGNFMGPDIGPAVFVGFHSSILGPITIGRGAQVGAHTVVVSDVPANAIVAGNPARIVAEGVPGPLERGLVAAAAAATLETPGETE